MSFLPSHKDFPRPFFQDLSESLPSTGHQLRLLGRLLQGFDENSLSAPILSAVRSPYLTRATTRRRWGRDSIMVSPHTAAFHTFMEEEVRWVCDHVAGQPKGLSEKACMIHMRAVAHHAGDILRGKFREKKHDIQSRRDKLRFRRKDQFFLLFQLLDVSLVQDYMNRIDNYDEWPLDCVAEFQPHVRSFVKAVMLIFLLLYIHPFGDGNGRTCRLLTVALLRESDFPPALLTLLLNLYNGGRREFYRANGRAFSENSVMPLLRFFVGRALTFLYRVKFADSLQRLPFFCQLDRGFWQKFLYVPAKVM